MGIEVKGTISRTNRLFWLGRYLERVHTTLTETRGIFEAETDGNEADYAAYCRALGIPDHYTDTADFVHSYYFDTANPYSIASTLGYAYDNAIVLRETLSSETLAYVQMAITAMELASQSRGPAVELQWVLDDIMAFRGSCEEYIADEGSRNVLKTGGSLERVDLYLRLSEDSALCRREVERLFNRLYKTSLEPDKEKLNFLVDTFLDTPSSPPGREALIGTLESLFPPM